MVHTSWGREHYRCMQLRTTGRTTEAEATPPRATLSVAAPVSETPGGRGSYTCGNCGGSGHNARRCTDLGTASKRKSTDLVYDDTDDAFSGDQRRIIPVTDLDGPDGAVLDGRKRVSDQWLPTTDSGTYVTEIVQATNRGIASMLFKEQGLTETEVEANARIRIEQRKREREMK